MNIATHCDNCGCPLGPDKYVVSPREGGVCVKRGWCPGCYETLHKSAAKDRGSRWYARVPSNDADDKYQEDNDYEYGKD